MSLLLLRLNQATDDSEPSDSADCKMDKLKNGDNLDRLSELPDSLILKILSSLEMRDVVRTTFLSKRWNDLWTTIPALCFKSDDVKGNEEEIRNFITQALLLWKGCRIQGFEIRFCGGETGIDESLYRDMNWWLRFATEKKVEELYLCLPCYGTIDLLPRCLYESSSIRKLSLLKCGDLHILGDVRWDQLKSLTIECYSVSEDVINRLVSGAPQLEIFELSILCDSNNNLSIRSCSLRKLSIHKQLYWGEDDYRSMLTIWAPNLETLIISGAAFSEYLLMDISSLTDATLDFEDGRDVVLGEPLRQILPTFQHVEKLTLSLRCFEVLAVMIMKGEYSFSPLLNVKLLRLTCNLINLHKIVGLLKIFPKLKMLDMCHSCVIYSSTNAGEPLTSEEHMLKNELTQLRTVKIEWEVYDYVEPIFEFIEFFLKHAAVLERIVIKIGGVNVDSDDMILAMEKELLSLQRSFPKVELIF